TFPGGALCNAVMARRFAARIATSNGAHVRKRQEKTFREPRFSAPSCWRHPQPIVSLRELDPDSQHQLAATFLRSWSRSSRRRILPVVVIGKLSTNSMTRGYSCLARRERTERRISSARLSLG